MILPRSSRTLTFLEAYDRFREIEEHFHLWEKSICGFPFWDCLRFPTFMTILEQTGIVGIAHRAPAAPEGFARIKSRASKLIDALLRNLFVGRRKYQYLFLGHPRRKLGPDGTYWDVYSDPIIDHLGADRSLLLERMERTYHGRHWKPAHTANLAYMEGFELADRIRRKLADRDGATLQMTDGEAGLLESVENRFYRMFRIPLDLTSQVRWSFVRHVLDALIYRRILQRQQPKVVFLVVSYRNESLIHACRKLSIPTVEIQHGTMSPYHVGYSYPSPASKRLFPDYFLTFGRYWEETVDLPIDRSNILTVGYPYLDATLLSLADRPKHDRIVFVSQGTIGRALSEFAVELYEMIPSEYEIVYKLHPGEVADWETRYARLAASGIKVIAREPPSLYELLAGAQFQVGVYSTAIFEGLALGCKTYIVELPGHEYMEPLVRKGVANLVQSPEQIDLHANGDFALFERDYFFAESWQRNLDRALAIVTGGATGDGGKLR